MKRHMILGGTGTLGRALTKEILKDAWTQVVCLSRCELKQKQMAADFRDSRLSFVLGDIRNRDLLVSAMDGANVVHHVAALKHIDVLEDNPEESVRTNILGTMNVAEAAVINRIPHVLFSSTDKAVDPVNAYGMSKGISEKILLRKNETQTRTHFAIYRWGNVLGSRGSAIHAFVDSLLKEKRVYLTDPEMTRFWIKIEEAVKFMLTTYRSAPKGDVLIPKIKAASVERLVATLANILNVKSYEIVTTGIRRGEKLHEALRSQHSCDMMDSEDYEQYTELELFYLMKDVLSETMPGVAA